jgi:hypothetical protein
MGLFPKFKEDGLPTTTVGFSELGKEELKGIAVSILSEWT